MVLAWAMDDAGAKGWTLQRGGLARLVPGLSKKRSQHAATAPRSQERVMGGPMRVANAEDDAVTDGGSRDRASLLDIPFRIDMPKMRTVMIGS
jgi:hypothetical protein